MNDAPKKAKNAESRLATTEPAAQPETFDVLILPSALFFIERIEVPAALDASELDDFAELSMEGLAPFPLEQLNWGFLVDSERTVLLLYATPKDRLKRTGYDKLEAYTWVLPDFACLYGARFPQALEVILHGENHCTRLSFPAGEGLPLSVQSLAPTKTYKENDEPSTTATLELQLIKSPVNEKARPTFHFETIGASTIEGHWSPLSPEETALWRADVRPALFKTTERSVRRTTALITRLIRYAAVFTLLLILLEGLLWVGQLWLGTHQAKIDSQTTAVRRVEDMQSLTNMLEQVSQNELRPIAILEAANRIRIDLGTTGIEYDQTVIQGTNRITIEGKANTINELNAYVDALQNSGTFQLVGSPRQITRAGRTTFSVTLDYQHPTEPAEPTPVDIPEDLDQDPESTP